LLSGDPSNEYFGDGLTEELINRIAMIPTMRVTARTTAFSYKGSKQDVRQIGQALDVATMLEGGVLRAGERVRVNVQLIRASDGYQLWSESYERDAGDILSIY
jgi:TolB-like protein